MTWKEVDDSPSPFSANLESAPLKRSTWSTNLFGRDFLPHGARALPGVGVGAKWG